MSDTERSRDLRIRPSEAEVIELFQEAAKQYEEYIRLADLADLSDEDKPHQPRYAWDNPIGLVVTERADAELVRASE